MTEPSPPDKEITHPSKDIVSVFDELRDQPWGWILEFPSQEVLKEYWNKLENWIKNPAHETNHPFTGDCVWIETSPDHPFQNRYYLSFFGWGFSIEKLPQWWDQFFGSFPTKVNAYGPSEEQQYELWEGFSEIQRLFFIAEEKIQVTRSPLPKRQILHNVIKSVPKTVPRYWSSKGLFGTRDFLIPVVTQQESQKKSELKIHFLEEYILEQFSDWKSVEIPGVSDPVILLPSGFEIDENEERDLGLPDFVKPAFLREPQTWDEDELDFGDYENEEDPVDKNQDDERDSIGEEN